MSEVFPLDRVCDVERHPSEFRLLERVPLTRADIKECLPHVFETPAQNAPIVPVVFMAGLATGFDLQSERLIALTLVRCTCVLEDSHQGASMRIVSVDACYEGLEDPSFPLSAKTAALSRLTNEDLRGRRFDEAMIRRMVADDPLIIADNGSLLRPFFERRFTSLLTLAWGCFKTDSQLRSLYGNATPDFILLNEGYFFDRAVISDLCLAMCFIMYCHPENLSHVYRRALDSVYRLEVPGFPREEKDRLKELRFRWDPDKRLWYYTADSHDALNEIFETLKDLDCNYSFRKKANVIRYSAYERFKPQ